MRGKRQTLLQLGILVAILVMANLLGAGYFTRLDMTENQRYSLTEFSQNSLDSVNQIMYIRVYLAGDLPTRVQRFKESVMAMMQEMKAYAGTELQYQFIDPSGNSAIKNKLRRSGVDPIPIQTRSEDQFAVTRIYPGAIIQYKGQKEVINLLQTDCFSTGRNNVNCDYTKAEAELEYKFISAIRRLMRGKKHIVGILTTHSSPQLKIRNLEQIVRQYQGMPRGHPLTPLIKELGRRYRVLPVEVDSGKAIPSSTTFLPDSITRGIKGEGIDVLIVPQLSKPLTERMKYELDQFQMRGGRILWALDHVNAQHEAFKRRDRILARPNRMNLQDLFLNYGFRMNMDLIQSATNPYADPFPTNYAFRRGQGGGRPQIGERPWIYFPRITRMADHGINEKVSELVVRYASSLETLDKDSLSSQVLLATNSFTRSLTLPVEISFRRMLAQSPPPQLFRGTGNYPVSLLLEGKFHSAYRGRPIPTDSSAPDKPEARFINQTPYHSKMMVIADGDILLPNHLYGRKESLPLNNLAFVMNAVEYLINDKTYAKLRAKTIEARRLDQQKVEDNKLWLQVLNLGAPVLVIALAGLARYYWRYRKNLNKKQAA